MNGQDPRDEFEARVRESLQRDGEQIRPDGDGLARIRERTSTQRSRGRNWLMAGAIGFATATAVVGAFFVTGDLLDRSSAPGPAAPTVQTETDEPDPTESPDPTETAPTPSASEPEITEPEPTEPEQEPEPRATEEEEPPPQVTEQTVPVYYLGDTSRGLRLFREFHAVESAQSEAVTALNQMLGATPRDPDYSSPWAADSRALSVDTADGLITVDLNAEVVDTSVPRETADLMVQQLVYTVQAALQDAGSPVRILVEGQPVSDISGSPTAEALTRADEIDVQAMTWIITPSQGATVPGRFEVTGVANAFEANVVWELVQGGEVVRDGFTTAEESMTFAPYSFTVRNVPAGDYTLRAFQTSAQDGSEEFVDTKDITVE